MSSKNDISQIRKYLNGELDARAMHELERRALDDPFLMDALSGYERAKGDQRANLDELSSRLQQRTDEKVKRMIPWTSIISIAASALLILGVGLRYFNRNTEPPKQLAEVETTVVKKDKAPQPPTNAATDSIKAGEYTTANTNSAAKQKTKITPPSAITVAPAVASPPAAEANPQLRNAEREKIAAPPPLKELRIARDKNITDTALFTANNKTFKKKAASTDQPLTSKAEGVTVSPLGGNRSRQDEEAKRLVGTTGVTLNKDFTKEKPRTRDTSDLDEAVVSVYSSQKKAASSMYSVNPTTPPLPDQFKSTNYATQRIIIGHVVGKDDRLPIVGATVKVVGKTFGVVTDLNGKFILKDVPANATLLVGYIGYNSTKIKVNTADTLNIILAPSNNALAEVVTTGSGVSSQDSNHETTIQSAQPADGWAAFKKYIDSKATSPDGQTGKVRLSFTVNGLGDLADFKVIKSMSKAADQAAIDMVKNGPAWTGSSDKKPQTVKVTIKFH